MMKAYPEELLVTRLALLGVNTSHADAFARIFNGTETDDPLIDDATITTIWGNDLARIDELATRHRIANRVTHPSDIIGNVDAVLVVDDTNGGALHAELAKPFLEAGIPVFVDKPMTTSYADAVELFEIAARTGAPLLSCSSLRFAVELEPARRELAKIGNLSSIISVGPGDWFYYGVHAVELLGAIAGTGATSIHRHIFPERDIAVIGYENGPTAVVETLRDASYVFELTAYGEDGHVAFEVVDSTGFYTNTMREVVRMSETGISPLTPDQTLEVLAILHAGTRSGEQHATVALADITSTP
jgi:virulence factor